MICRWLETLEYATHYTKEIMHLLSYFELVASEISTTFQLVLFRDAVSWKCIG